MQGATCLRRLALVTAAAASLAACASVQPGPTAGLSPPADGPGAGGRAEGGGPSAGMRVGPPYQVGGIWYVPRMQPHYDEVGVASWYGDAFDGRLTADGEIFDMRAVSGAHTTLPLPCIVEVTNLENGRRLQVRVNDRGPFVGDRIIDLSHEAARQLGYDRQGLARVRVRFIGPAPLLGPEAGVRVARARPAPRSDSASVQYASAGRPYAARLRAAPAAPSSDDDEVVFTGAPASAHPRRLQIVTAMPGQTARGGAYRVQAAAFSDEDRARRAAAQLGELGPAAVEPVQRDGARLWRVVLTDVPDLDAAFDLRERVIQAGFAGARVIGGS